VAQLDLAHHFARDVGPGRLVLAECRARPRPVDPAGALLIGLGLATLLGSG
jgi:hypothetical protein